MPLKDFIVPHRSPQILLLLTPSHTEPQGTDLRLSEPEQGARAATAFTASAKKGQAEPSERG